MGDSILKTYASRLVDTMGSGSLVCRWGGDEFVAFKPCCDKDISEFANSISLSLKDSITINDTTVETGASIGVSVYPEHSQSIDELISYADMAMYVNKGLKGSKQNQASMFNVAMAEKLASEFYLSTSIKESITKGQLVTFFQPIIDSKTSKVAGVEALIRWSLYGKFIPPDVFIPIIEKNGFINELGYWVLKDSLSKIKAMGPCMEDLFVCVNVSLVQLQDKNFVHNVEAILKEVQFDPNKLNIELTESVFSFDKEFLKEKVLQLRALGIKIAIDDFGTGYSSLSLIQSLRVNKVKIDRSFVARLEDGGLEVIRAVLTMAKGFNYDIVAEGVETPKQAEVLAQLGIKYLQGYLYSKPLPVHLLIEHPLLNKNFDFERVDS